MDMADYEQKPDAASPFRLLDDSVRRLLSNDSAQVALVGVAVAVVLTVILLAAGGATTPVSLLGLGLTSGIIALAWLDNRADQLGKAHAWSQLAEQTGLTYTAGRILMGQGIYVAGTYRGRPLTLSTRRQGKGQVQSTRIDVYVDNLDGARLRMRGPFLRGAVEIDTVTSDLFGTTQARPFGDERRFFIRSHPLHLATTLVGTRPLWDELLALGPLTNIELEGQTLSFERLGLLRDVATLHHLFDLLSDMADVLEHRAAPLLAQRSSGNPASAHTMSATWSSEASPSIK
jgi:hypothetical protein